MRKAIRQAYLHEELQVLLGKLRRLDHLLEEAMPDHTIRALGRDAFELVVDLPQGRKQRVIVDKEADLVRVSSLCAEVREEVRAMCAKFPMPH